MCKSTYTISLFLLYSWTTDTMGDDHNRPISSALVTVVTCRGWYWSLYCFRSNVASAIILQTPSYIHQSTYVSCPFHTISKVHLHAGKGSIEVHMYVITGMFISGTSPTHSPAERDCGLTVNPAYHIHTHHLLTHRNLTSIMENNPL